MEVCLETNRKAGLPRSRLKQYKTSEGEVGLGLPGGTTRLALHLEASCFICPNSSSFVLDVEGGHTLEGYGILTNIRHLKEWPVWALLQ